ncbi:hypothetical protein AVEN_76688-1 [Araneus ventricosus]|uniref:Uncharacterized protein n=1 Tax=Araneus ventricosus TaxID=182803 RepID=A0A4Y2BPU5_ARAVE|nr:hypothetical protein AVEN_76688-1 [Araneus ventricosus]
MSCGQACLESINTSLFAHKTVGALTTTGAGNNGLNYNTNPGRCATTKDYRSSVLYLTLVKRWPRMLDQGPLKVPSHYRDWYPVRRPTGVDGKEVSFSGYRRASNLDVSEDHRQCPNG